MKNIFFFQMNLQDEWQGHCKSKSSLNILKIYKVWHLKSQFVAKAENHKILSPLESSISILPFFVVTSVNWIINEVFFNS